MTRTTYPVGIVGESNYQRAIRQCRVGERVTVMWEDGNPYDDKAIVVKSSRGETIGYIARDHWLREAVGEQGKACMAVIKTIAQGHGNDLGIVIDLSLADGPMKVCSFPP